MKKYIIYTDGASRGNPGQAASGFIIKTEDGVVLMEEAKCLGVATNNEAEYIAIKLALQKLSRNFSADLPSQVEIRTDSQLVARQLEGIYKVKHPNLRVLFEDIKRLEKGIGKVIYIHIPREENFKADLLVNRSLDKQNLKG